MAEQTDQIPGRVHGLACLRPVDIPEGASGSMYVKRFTVSQEAASFERIRAMAHPGHRAVPAGTYTGLFHGESILMSDTPDEMRDHRVFVWRAKGEVLIAGLGLGMALQAVAAKPEVTKVTVLEVSSDVIGLVWPTYAERFGGKVTLIEADAMTWKPPRGSRYDAVWFDIWASPPASSTVRKIKERYRRRSSWVGCWAEGARW